MTSPLAPEDKAENKFAEDLHDADESYGVLAEAATDAIIRIDENSIVQFVNSAASRIFGYGVDEMRGRSLTMLMPEELRARHDAGLARYIATGQRNLNWESIEIIGLHKSGRQFPLEISFGDYNRAGKRFFIGIARDITQRKETERLQRKAEQAAAESLALQVQAAERLKQQEERVKLLAQVLTSQADERRRISRDMHDHFGQQLTALRLHLEALGEMCTEQALIDKVSEAREMARQLDSDVSFLVWELRPTDLDEVGLKAALTQYAEKWSAQFNVNAEFHVGNFDEQDISGEAQTTLYRIVQEALNNVQKYAHSSKVSVLLERRGDELVLIVEDDGKGFDPNEKIEGGFGLLGMRERTALIGGTVEIESAPGQGTAIFVRIPI